MNKINIKLKNFFIILIILLFFIITVGNILIAKKGIHSIFIHQIDKYFDQSTNFIQTVFDERGKEVSLLTDLITIPQEVLNASNKNLHKFLLDSTNEYIDFLIYIPSTADKKSVSAGLFLYDIKALQEYLEENIHNIRNEDFVNIKTQGENYGFLLAKKSVVDNESGQVQGTLVGGFELGFHSVFLNKIKRFTGLNSIYLFSNGEALNSKKKIPEEKSTPFYKLLQSDSVTLTQHRRLKLAGEPIDLEVAMVSNNTSFEVLRQQLKSDIFLLSTVMSLSFLFLIFTLQRFLTKPLYSLRKYAGELSAGKTTQDKPVLTIQEYNDLQNYLQELFTKLLETQKRIKELATRDRLTKLFNRRHMEESLFNTYEYAKRYKETFSIVIVDIDFFKNVNDSYGHQAGDAILKEFANIFQNNARKTDTIARWGGEEFMILLPKTPLSQAEEVAQKIKAKINQHTFPHVGKKSASFGVAQFHIDIETTIKKADEALYRAKELGRNQVQVSKSR